METAEVNKALHASPAFRVTDDAVNTTIHGRAFHRLTPTLTVCVLTLRNGFTVTGESACASPDNYRRDLGEHFAFEDAKRKVDAFEAYAYLDRKDRGIGEFEGFAQDAAPLDDVDPAPVTENDCNQASAQLVGGSTSPYDDQVYRRHRALDMAIGVADKGSSAQQVIETAQAFERYMMPSELPGTDAK